MAADMKIFTISELAEEAGVTPRTIRFYTAEGLLPPPDTRGRYARYGEEHLDRLRLIQQLKEAFLPLHAIRTHLDTMDSEGLAASAHAPADIGSSLRAYAEAPPASPRESASEYIRKLMDRIPPVVRERSPMKAAAPRAVTSSHAIPTPPQLLSEQWERIRITPELELHVKAPRSPQSQKLIDRLVGADQAALNPKKEGP